MSMVSLAQKARSDVNATINGDTVDMSNLHDLERAALEMAGSKQWVKGSDDREALLDIYEELFAHIEKGMAEAK